jgi:hypothetical protein
MFNFSMRMLERVPMGSNQLSTVMPALVAGIHVSLARSSASKAWMAGTSPAMTPEKWFNLTGIRSRFQTLGSLCSLCNFAKSIEALDHDGIGIDRNHLLVDFVDPPRTMVIVSLLA